MSDPATREQKLESYRDAHRQLTAYLQSLPLEVWQFRAEGDPWTIHDIVVHITDSEANSYVRCRRAIAEPGLGVMAYDPSVWSEGLHYGEQSAEEALELFKWLRLRTARLISTLPESTWAHTIEHPENGTMTLDDWLNIYERHVPEHLEQMEAIHAAWRKQRGRG